MLRRFEHSQVYRPTPKWDTAGSDLGRPFEDVYFMSADGVRLNAWFFPADAGSPRSNLAILICHGNGGNVSHRLDLCRMLLQTGVNVLVFDYRGYGRSEGSCSEEGTYADAVAAWQWLRQRGFAARNIIALGKSLGGAVACELALRVELGGLIMESAFASIAAIGAERFPWLPVRWLHTIKYDNLDKLARVRIPVLVMHSRADKVIRFHHGEKIFAAAGEPKMFWETTGGHNHGQPSDYDRCREGIEKFLRLLENAAVPSAIPNP
jgi:fermentation-respiration switch protein FrsA (DUF1100 family)